MTGITGCAKAGELDGFCESVRRFALAVIGLTENSSQVILFTSVMFVMSIMYAMYIRRHIL